MRCRRVLRSSWCSMPTALDRPSPVIPPPGAVARRVVARARAGDGVPDTGRSRLIPRPCHGRCAGPSSHTKNSVLAQECERADLRRDRYIWRHLRQPRMRRMPERLGSIDETSTNTKMTQIRGRSRRRPRLHASAPFGHRGTRTCIAGLRCDGHVPPVGHEPPGEPPRLQRLYPDPARANIAAQ